MKDGKGRMKGNGRILVIGQDGGAFGSLPVALTGEGHSLVTAKSGEEAVEKAKRGPFDVAVVDEELPDIEAMDLAASLKELHPGIAIVVAAVGASGDQAKAWENDRIAACVAKPVEADEVLARIAESLDPERSAAESEKPCWEVRRELEERRRKAEALRTSEARYRSLVDTAGAGIGIADLNGVFVFVNKAVCRMLGYSRQALLGRRFLGFLHPDDREEIARSFLKGLEGQRTHPLLEFRATRGDGHTVWFCSSPTALVQENETIGFSAILHDITERKQVEEALRRSEEKYRHLIEDIRDGYLVVRGSKVLLANRVMAEALGLSAEEITGASFLQHLTPESRDKSRRIYERTKRGEALPDIEYFELQLADGSTMPAEMRFKEIAYEGEKAYSILLRDITERKRAEEALQESERRYRLLAENATDVIWTTDLDLRFTYVSPSVTRLQGYTVEEAMALTVEKRFAPSSLRLARRVLAQEMAAERRKERDPSRSRTLELELYRKDGSTVWTEVTVTFLRDEAGEATGILGITRDITERKQARETLEDSERKYRNLVERANDGIFVVRDGAITFVNQRMAEMAGYAMEDIVGRPFVDFLHPDEVATVVDHYRRRMAGEDVSSLYETILKRKDGTDLHVEINAGVFQHQGQTADFVFVRDITERKRAEEEIHRHTKRVEALHAIGQTASQTLDLNELLEKALARVLEVTDSDAGGIYLLEAEGGDLVLKAHRGVSKQYARATRTISLDDEGLRQDLMSEGFVPSLDQVLEKAGMGTLASRIAAEKLRASIGVPFRSKDVPQGVLVIARRKPIGFTEEEIELLQAVGSEIGVGVENARLLERARELSVTDELTGLFNRRHFYEALEAEINRTGRRGCGFSLVMLDVDGFKEYSDRRGHISGDALLRFLADTLKSSLRKSDTGFRYNGDKFTIILPGTDSAKATRIVNRIRPGWLRCAKPEGFVPEPPLGFNAGIAEFPADAGTADGLVFLADTALFHSKRQGGYRTTLVSELGTVTLDAADQAVLDHVYALAATVDARDTHTYGHSTRVAGMSERIGTAVGLPSEGLLSLHAAALLHDIGKIGVPDSILTKPGKLTQEERRIVEKHAAEGARIVGHIRELAALVPMVRHHHEWYDGAGYPERLRGDDIPLGARIIAIADAHDTMTTTRPYRVKVSGEEAIEELRRCAGSQFDPDLVEVFVKMVRDSTRNGVEVRG